MQDKSLGCSFLGQMLSLLSPREKKQFFFLIPLMATGGLIAALGVASVMPFLALLGDPQIVERNRILSRLYDLFGSPEREMFFLYVGLALLLFLTASNAISGITTWALLRFSWMRNHTISMRLLKGYLARPYPFFLSRNSTELSRNILGEVQQVVANILVQVLNIIQRSLVVAFISIALVVAEPFLSAVVLGVFGGTYALLFWVVRRKLGEMGKERLAAQGWRYRLTSEIFAGIKEVKLLGLEEEFARAYSRPSAAFAEKVSLAAAYAQLPRFLLETLAFGGLLSVIFFLLKGGRDLASVLPFIGFFSFAAYRIMPSLQVIFTGVAAIRFNQASLQVLCEDLREGRHRQPKGWVIDPSSSLTTYRGVALRNASYCYPGREECVFQNVDLEIQRGEWVAVIGPTGSGKSTLVDLFLGLLQLSKGALLVNGIPIDRELIIQWQALSGYVPQSIFLSDDSVEHNICFGQGESLIDRKAMKEAAAIAQIDEFIRNDLAEGYKTIVGERGVRLSGGQRQRLGIARALYRKPAFLVLDEATSALDDATERRFFTALREEFTDTTVISIAHRFSTTEFCDRLIEIANGTINERRRKR